jgi:hypothetical protein
MGDIAEEKASKKDGGGRKQDAPKRWQVRRSEDHKRRWDPSHNKENFAN